MGAVRQASGGFAAKWPDVDVDWFAVPGAPFRRCKVIDNRLTAEPKDAAETTLISRINGDISKNITDFDHLWVIGYRFGMGDILQGWLDKSPSDAVYKMIDRVRITVDQIHAQFGNDKRITVTSAPYPALRCRGEGPFHESRIAAILKHEDPQWVCDSFEEVIGEELDKVGYGYMPQPDITRAQPFTTQNEYLKNARDFSAVDTKTTDLRHMNEQYGAILFDTYAHTILGMAPATPNGKDT